MHCIGGTSMSFFTKSALAVLELHVIWCECLQLREQFTRAISQFLGIFRRVVELQRCGDLVGGAGLRYEIRHCECESGRQRREEQVPARAVLVVRVCAGGLVGGSEICCQICHSACESGGQLREEVCARVFGVVRVCIKSTVRSFLKLSYIS